ncbi:MAG: hypothetical protein E7625_01575 [Ruminococcaceae bacterium]|nr:hypothetical protein [Oscillospiraceae bacterium]
MKKTLRILVCVALLALIGGSIVACKPKEPPVEMLHLIANGATSYTVVRSETANVDIRKAAVRVCAVLKEKTGLKDMPINEDYVKRGEPVPTDTLEILVGMTNRAESIEAHAQLSENEYVIAIMNKRLVIIGYDDAATVEAVDYFVTNILETNATTGAFAMAANFSMKNSYTPPVVNPFDPDLPIFPEQNKPTTTPLSYPKPTYTLSGGMYVQEYQGMKLEGVMTTFQTGTMFSDLYAVNSDSVMVYANDYKHFADWYEPGTYVVDMMLAINRASKTYVSQYKRQDDVQTNSSGSFLEHSAGTDYYMVPTERWIDYVWENRVKPVIIACHPQTIALEEPEMWAASGYSKSFKAEWKAYYGEEWQDPASSPENMLKANLLKTYLFERIIVELSSRIKELSPTTQVYIATHSTVNYSDWGIDAGLNHYVATGALDGVIGQTWSDTQNTAFLYRGGAFTDNFTNAFIEYSSYVDSVEGLNFYALADPMMDNASFTEEDCQYLYRQSIAAILMQPEINRFQILPWVNRAFANVSNNYRTIQSQIYEMLNNVGGEDVKIEAGTPGITYLISDSLSWMNPGSGWALGTTDGLYGVTASLVREGIPTKMKSMDQIESAADLEGVTVLIVSFDSNVPLNEKINIAIADWVKAGGTLLFISGSNQYWSVDDYFFWQEDGSPLNNLFKHLELDDIKVSSLAGGNSISASDPTLKSAFNDQRLSASYRRFAITFEGASNPILTVSGKAVGIDERVEDGRVIAIGLSSAFFGGHSFGPEMMRALTEYALNYTDYDYVTTDLMTVRRGNVVAAHAYHSAQTLKGTYINLYSAQLSILKNPVVPKDDSVVLYDVSGFDLSVPRLGFTAGTIQSGSLVETADSMTYTVTSAGNTLLSNRILLPAGVYPKSISITKGEDELDLSLLQYDYDEASNSIFFLFDGGMEPITVTIKWGDDKNAIKDITGGLGEVNILTNESGADEKYLVKNTAGVSASVRFCDDNRELIYKFDTRDYDSPVYQVYIAQNYIIEVSGDGQNWTLIADYSKGGTVDRVTNADNATVITIDPTAYEEIGNDLYIRIRNTATIGSHGAAVSRIVIRHTTTTAVKPNRAPGKNNTTTEFIPERDDNSTNESDFLVSVKNGIASYQRTVRTNSSNEDYEFLDFSSAGVNSGVRFCDNGGILIYAFDLSDMLSAKFTFYLAQNYILEVSTDGENYTMVADYSEGGKVPHLPGGGNDTTFTLDPFTYGAKEGGVFYVRIRNCYPSKGFGGCISRFVMEYTKEEK